MSNQNQNQAQDQTQINTSYPITAEFDIGQIDVQDLGKKNFQGEILQILPSGLFPNADVFNIDNAEEVLSKWAFSINLLKEGDKYYKKFTKNFASLTAFFAPNFQLSDPKMVSLMYVIAFYFVLDDIVDNANDMRSSSIEQSVLIEAFQVFCDIFKGKYSDISEIPDINFPLYKPLCQNILDIRSTSMGSVKIYQSESQFFEKDMIHYLNSVLIENIEFKKEHDLSEASYMYLRKGCSGVAPTFEFIALMNGVKLSKDIRKNLVFKRLKETGVNAVAITNDIFSLRKEMANDETTNLILAKKNHNKIPLQEAFAQAIHFLNDEIKDFVKLSHQLRSSFPNNIDLDRYIMTMENMIDGHVRWYGNCVRYGNIQLNFKQIESNLPFNYRKEDN